MNPEQRQRMVTQFGLDLKDECIGAGKPAYSKIGATINYSPATISRVFTGKKLPRWAFVEAFLSYCKKSDDEIAQWRERWAGLVKLTSTDRADDEPNAVHSGVTPIDKAIRSSGPREECELCGVAVLNGPLHRRWHATDPKAPRIRVV
jgi:hypothetical protein